MVVSAALDRARAAFAERDWVVARDLFRTAAKAEPLGTDDRHLLAQCAWWLGEVDECDRCLADVHRRYLDEERPAEAASTALELAINHFLRGDYALASGWMSRVTSLADGLPDSPLHGYVTYVREVETAVGDRDLASALAAARRVRDFGRRFADPNLRAAGLNGEGRMLIKCGRPAEGLALLDEAMVSVLAGDVDPDWVGNIYCNTISAFHELGDLRRMTTWTEAAESWLDTLPVAVLYAGICRVHRAQLHRVHGRWEQAERDAVRVSAELAGISVFNVAAAWYEVGEVRRLRGDHAGAERAYRSAHENGRDPQPGIALLRLAQGKVDAAAASVRTALIATTDPLSRAGLCAAQVEIALAADEPETARKAADELAELASTYASSGLEAMAATANGAVALGDGNPEEALPLLRDACRRWRELNAPYDAARGCVLLARTYQALGDTDTMAMELDAAAAGFDRLGAVVDARNLAQLTGASPAPGGLSRREVEVLGLVAAGRTNRGIAETLFISEKTVARHLSNIFAKLGVASRAEATRYAFEHGLAPDRSS